MRFPRIPPISPRDLKISRGGRKVQERQRQIEIGQEEPDTNPVRVAKNTLYARHGFESQARDILTGLVRDEGGVWRAERRQGAGNRLVTFFISTA